MSESSQRLQRIIAGASALEKARTVREVKVIRDQAKAIADYISQQKNSDRAGMDADELKLRAEFKLGELIPKQFPNGGNGSNQHKKELMLQRETLADIGITRTQSHRWQRLHSIGQDALEDFISESRAASRRPAVSAGIRKATHKRTLAKLKSIETKTPGVMDGLYDVLVIDPPWPMEKIERDCRENQSSALDYPVMTIEEIKSISIPGQSDCHLWLWTTQRFLPAAFDILNAWRFVYTCCFVWHKPGGFQIVGLPQFNCEFALYGRRGSPIFSSLKGLKLCFQGKRLGHSAKPEAFYEMLRNCTVGRRGDMFNRRKIDGFDGWGKETK